MKVRSNLLTEIKRYYLTELANLYGADEAGIMLNLLIEHFFGLKRTDQLLQPNFRLTETEMLKLHFAVKELKRERPVQYITGEVEFCGINLKVNPSVLIPRPETEELVDKIVKENVGKTRLTVLDIGTGSGSIALALKKLLTHSDIVAVDVSEKSLLVARENSLSTSLNVEFVKLNILNRQEWGRLEVFDLIVSNPPYVTESDKKMMSKNVVDNEPYIALFVTDDDPLLFYNAIANFALTHLNKGGELWFEINEKFGDDIRKLLENNGFVNVNVYSDFRGKDRFISARRGL